MLLKDLTILGRACPEPLKDGRVTVCLAGYSYEYGFIRLYPTHPQMQMSQWDVIEVEVERNEQDTRDESWKIIGSKEEWDNLPQKIKVIGSLDNREERRNLIGNLTDVNAHALNEQKRSLGIVKPEVLETYFGTNSKFSEWKQMGLPGFTDLDKYFTKRDYEKEPRVKYRCPQASPPTEHDQQVIEWGFYEWFRKNPENIEQVWENAGFRKPNTDLYFLLGNLFKHRNSFMVISVLRVPSGAIIKPMFELKKRTLRDEKP
jgi:hypothetical protein